jgi:hypothetical protein
LKNKAIVPRIVKVIHDSLPDTDGLLSGELTPQKIREIAASTPRGERRIISIDSLSMDYVPDLNDPVWPKNLVEAEPPLNDFTNQDIPGILIKIVCTTPNQNGAAFIREAFINPLRTQGRVPGMGFYVDRVHLVRGEKYAPRSAGPRGGRRTTPPAGRAPTPGATTPLDLDPITNEPMTEDWEFEIYMDAVLNDYADVGKTPSEKSGRNPSKGRDDGGGD